MASLPHDIHVAPSILSSEFARLGSQVEEVMAAGARVIHVDVMDGHFVPPITIGPLIVDALAEQVKGAGGLLDVHLMIERPERHIAQFAEAGADHITIHTEATPHLEYALGAIREGGCTAGAVICPGTPVAALGEVSDSLDLALCMSVNPGWGGQPFIEASLDKLERMRALLCADTVLQVDGGVDMAMAPRVVAAGATLLVAGSAVFGAPDPGASYRELTAAAGAA